MIDHLSTYATDFEKSKRFYDAVLAPLGAPIQVEMVASWDEVFPERRMAAFEQDGLTVGQFYRAMQDELGERLLVDKTPSYTLDVATLRRAERDFDGAFYRNDIGWRERRRIDRNDAHEEEQG